MYVLLSGPPISANVIFNSSVLNVVYLLPSSPSINSNVDETVGGGGVVGGGVVGGGVVGVSGCGLSS